MADSMSRVAEISEDNSENCIIVVAEDSAATSVTVIPVSEATLAATIIGVSESDAPSSTRIQNVIFPYKKLLNQLKLRNAVQVQPFKGILTSSNTLWKENTRLIRLHNDIKTSIHELQYDVSSVIASSPASLLPPTVTSNDSNKITALLYDELSKVKSKLSAIQHKLQIQRTQLLECKQIDLVEKLRKQNKLLLLQREEIKLSMKELQESLENAAIAEKEIHRMKAALIDSDAELLQTRKENDDVHIKNVELEQENKRLIEQLMKYKNSMADKLNAEL